MNRKVDIVIPTYRPTAEFREVLQKLLSQTLQPERILLINTEEELFDPRLIDGLEKVSVVHIHKQEFDHGGTRGMAASMLHNELILFLTQDAVPKNEHLTEILSAAFDDEQVCASYARQLPRTDCSLIEQITREFNYPAESRVKTEKDLPDLGVKTFFCSNVCAMYRRSAYEKLGGFEEHTIFNEDMIFAGKLIRDGKAIAYCADAQVIHSHNYTGIEQFHRNFDLGVSQAEHPEIFSGIHSESEGINLVKQTARALRENGHMGMEISLIWISGCKYLGYRLGKNYRHLPKMLARAFSLNKEYWA